MLNVLGTDETRVTVPCALGSKPVSAEVALLDPVPAAGGGALPLGVSSSGWSWKPASGVKLSSTGWPATVPVTCTFMTIPTLAPTDGMPVAFWT